MADVSISDLVQRVRDLLQDTSAYQTTSTTTGTGSPVAVPDGTLWVQGDVGEWQTGAVGYEQFWLSAAPTVNDLNVKRGYNGTTAETHTSGDIIVQNPVFAGRAIQQALTQSVYQLWPHVYKTTDISLTPDTTKVWYDLNAATRGIVRAYQQFGTSPALVVGNYSAYANEARRGYRYMAVDWDFDLPATTVASGKGIRFPSGLYHSTNTIHVRDMRTITGTSDIPDDGELPVAEAVVYLAAGRLLEAGEVNRVSSGSDLEESGSVGTGSRLQTGSYYRGIGKEKLDALALAMKEKYQPIRMWK
jgi:hypothetical protein